MERERVLEIIQSICCDLYPPTNPAVILAAAREWYLQYGADAVYQRCIQWLAELEKVQVYDMEIYVAARKLFEEKTKAPVERPLIAPACPANGGMDNA